MTFLSYHEYPRTHINLDYLQLTLICIFPVEHRLPTFYLITTPLYPKNINSRSSCSNISVIHPKNISTLFSTY